MSIPLKITSRTCCGATDLIHRVKMYSLKYYYTIFQSLQIVL